MDNIIKYFDGEKIQCITGVIISIICISTSVYFLFLQNSLLKGIAYTFIPLSLFLLIVCASVIIRTPKDVERVSKFYTEEPQKMKSEELPRMQSVMKSFSIVLKVEIGILLAGVILGIFFWGNPLMKGIALGLIIQGIILYLFDYTADWRAEEYLKFLKSL